MKRVVGNLCFATALLTLAATAAAQTTKVEVLWLGQFALRSPRRAER